MNPKYPIFIPTKGRYKTPYTKDFTYLERATLEFSIKRKELVGSIIPDQKIPWAEMATMRPRCRVYQYYHQLFNQRQLISLAMILQEILNIENK